MNLFQILACLSKILDLRLAQACGLDDEFHVGSGGLNGMYFYEELCYGAQGCIPTGEFPDAFINTYNAFTSGDKVLAK